jgi:WD40 repeat protein
LARPPPAIPGHVMLRRIGSGSYGEVWLARHEVLSAYCAVKVVYRDRFAEERPFDRELEGIQRFEPISRSHPSQVSILQVGRSDKEGYIYYAMELADDQRSVQRIDPEHYEPRTLRSELKQRGRLPFADCLKIGLALTTALEHLHGRGLIHRDIKPSNVIFVHGLPKLADPGLMAETDQECSFVGTEGYVAPEGPGRQPADIYALGKLLYEMMTGLSPKESSSLGPKEKYPSLPEGWDKAPDFQALNELRQVVLRACEPDLKRRYQTVEEMQSELELLKSHKSLVRLRKLQRAYRRLLLTAAGVAGMTVLGGLGVGFLVLKNRAAEENHRRELREIRIARSVHPQAGWFTNNWSRLERAAALRMNQEVLEQASAMLAGLDMRPVMFRDHVAASSAAFGPDGHALVGGVGMGAGMLIDTNGAMTELPVQGEGPVCWTPEGAALQFIAVSNRFVIRDARTGAVRRDFQLPGAEQASPDSATVLAVASDGSSVAAGLGDRVCVWSAATGESLGNIATEASALAFSPDGSLLGAGAMDGTTRVYTVPSLAEVALLPPASRGSPILCLAFGRARVIPSGTERPTNAWLLATGDQGADIVIWDLQRRLPRTFCRGSTWIVTALGFAPDGLTLASAGQGEGRLWDVTSGEALFRLSYTPSGRSRFVVFDSEGRRLICGGEPGAGAAAVVLWEMEHDRGIHVLRGLDSAARKVWFSADSRRLAALTDDWHLGVWEAASGSLVFLFETPVGVLADNAAGCFDASGSRFAFASGREACLYDLATGRVVQKWSLADGLADQLQSDARGRLLLLRREQAFGPQRWIWRLHELAASARPVLLHEQTETNWSALDMAFAPGGERFLVWNGWPGEAKQYIRAIDVTSGRELWKAATETPRSDMRVCLDPAGRSFAYMADLSLHLCLMRLSDFKEMGATADRCQAIGPSGKQFTLGQWLLLDHPGSTHGIPLVTDWRALSFVSAFSPDGRLLAWATEEGVVLVADIEAVRRRLSALGR